MIRKLTAHSSLESLKKEAKRWLKELRAGDPEALARLQQVLPGASVAPGLREIQQALAREFGADSWAVLKLHLADQALARRTHAERLEEFLEHAILNYGIPPGEPKWDPRYPDHPSRRAYAARVLAKHPEIVAGSIHAAVICGDVAEVERLLKQDRRAASTSGGQRRWEPLLYLAYARLPVAAAIENSVAIAELLLDHGANPNVQMSDGLNPFTPVTGFIGEGERTPLEVPPHPRAEELVRLLIERGANSFDTQALYNTSLWNDSTAWLDLLYGYDQRAGTTARWNEPGAASVGQLDYLIGNAVDRNHVRRVEWLLAHGANPRAGNTYTKRNLHTHAVLHGFAEMAELLAKAGANVEDLHGREAFQAACLRLDIDTARTLAAQHPEYLKDATALATAARTGRVDVVELLLDLGVSADVEDANGERALHVASWADSVPVARLLIERGAEVDARDRRFNGTPLSCAIYLGKPQLIDYLSTVSRDVFCLVVAGKVERLRALLQAQPSLAKTVRDDQTALFCLPNKDEELAIEIAELLLAHGADPSFKNSAGLTAAGAAERNGMDALAQLLRDASPA
jgi:ankyrin repeat protein